MILLRFLIVCHNVGLDKINSKSKKMRIRALSAVSFSLMLMFVLAIITNAQTNPDQN